MRSSLSRYILAALCLGAIVSWCDPIQAKDDVVPAERKIQAFELDQVRLLPSPFKTAQDKNSQYLLSVEPDRLLARLRTNAGLDAKAPNYEGWESQSIAGHSLGHYLSAVSKSYASTGDERFKERALYVVSELAACQDALGYGMLEGDKRYEKVFAEIKKGNIRSQGFDLNGLWVPWYTLHKIFAGLLDAYRYCDCDQALDVAKKLGDWGIDVIQDLSFEQMQKMLACEYGGTNEAFYSLYAATGDEKYLKAGDRFYDLAVIKALSEGRDELQNRHANTQIPKIIGLARRFEVAGNGEVNAFPTADFFWNRVVNYHSYAIGGNSLAEHLGAPGIISSRLVGNTCESCNTYNMLKLTQKLYMQTGKIEYVNFFERALYNHILASIDKSGNPDSLYTYFVPLEQGGFRTYSTREKHWTCCHGTGMENHSQYNGEIYYRQTLDDGTDVLYINLSIPSILTWEEKGIAVELDPQGNLTIDAKSDVQLDVRARVPNNCSVDENALVVKDGYACLGTTWNKGKTTKRLAFNANWIVEPTPDNPNVAAFFRGPVLYAGNVGPIDKPIAAKDGAFVDAPNDNVIVLPVVVSDSKDPAALVDDAGKESSFFVTPEKVALTNVKPQDVLSLVPFYAASERYCAYFDFFTPQAWQEKQNEYLAQRAKLAKLNEATLQFFQPGEMQPERDADFDGKNSRNGIHKGRKWRDAVDGYFEFNMKVDPEKDCALVVTYWGEEVGNRVFDILIDGKKIAERKLDRDRPGQFFDECYAIPNPDRKSTVRVRFQSKPGATAGGIFGARSIREDVRKELFND